MQRFAAHWIGPRNDYFRKRRLFWIAIGYIKLRNNGLRMQMNRQKSDIGAALALKLLPANDIDHS